jgi:hypothetical protein
MRTDEVDETRARHGFSVVRVTTFSAAAMRHRRPARPGLRGEENYAYGVDAAINPHSNLSINSYW